MFGLIGAAQGFDHFVHVAGNDLVELVQGQIDAVIGEPALRKVVGADAFTAVARTDQRAAMVGRHLIGFAVAFVLDAREQHLHRLVAVAMLRAIVLTLRHDAGRQVRDAHRRLGLVDVLSART